MEALGFLLLLFFNVWRQRLRQERALFTQGPTEPGLVLPLQTPFIHPLLIVDKDWGHQVLHLGCQEGLPKGMSESLSAVGALRL